MGKRKNNGEADISPKKEKKTMKFDDVTPVRAEKRPAADSSDSDPDEDEEEQTIHTEAEETRHDDGPMNYEPDAFRLLVESFTAFVQEKNATTAVVHNMERLVTEWIQAFATDYRKYLKQATKIRNFQLNDASTVLLSYLGGDKALSEFPSFPEKPPTKFQLYIKENKIDFKGGKAAFSGASMRAAHKGMNEDVAGSKKMDEQLHKLHTEYIPRLQDFIDSHPNLTLEQQQFIGNKIKSLDKKYNSKPIVPKTPKKPKNKSAKKEIETAFSLFCRSKNEKYRDLSDEERERKLKKKFDKLPAETRDLFESLALNI
ncbi:hypothetical protein GCK72_018515 [Caenorhabditis remanei]|uniref:Uncharacterized protein n=1 Tax=Caenorhabditis remanei TaxID=31234 RepID=A0A6A5GB00_CAERE|nr:hypothetical protein GCK72_018515 [Caenorhabditis remanei]KAF1751961.1 hypothetical protein GCK72_018515 [Caenorhabditis remanei]